MSPVQTVSALRPGEHVDGVFACTRKDRLMSRNGSPYLALELRDRTGTVPARAFREADLLGGRFDRGDLVQVAGRVERFRDELVVEIADIARAVSGDGTAVDPAAFLPTAYRDLDELEGFLEHLAREVYDARYRALTARGKCKQHVVTAVGRELLGFIWAIGVQVEAETGGPKPIAA